jgi:hypothetical protein
MGVAKYGTETRAAYIRARASGLSIRAAADRVGVSWKTGERWGKELQAEIQKERRAEMENTAAQYSLYRRGRLERLGKLLDRLDRELEARPLDEINTATLLLLRLKYGDAAAREMEPIDTAALPQAEAEKLDAKAAGRRLVELFRAPKPPRPQPEKTDFAALWGEANAAADAAERNYQPPTAGNPAEAT